MRITFLPLLWAFLASCLTSVAFAQFPVDRSLTDSKGRELDATILSEANGKIHILRKTDGKQFHISMADLSNADQVWLENLRKPAVSPSMEKPLVEEEKSTPATSELIPIEPDVQRGDPIKITPLSVRPDPPKQISNEEIFAEQIARGMVPPPEGWDALQTTIRFKNGRTISGYVYDLKEGQFWYADMDMIQKTAGLSELSPLSRITIENWRKRSKNTAAPSMAFMVDGKKIYASLLSADENQATFLTDSDELMENVAVSKLDEMSRNFVKEWLAGTWKPDKWEWAVPAEFTAVKPFSENGYAFAKKKGKWGVIDYRGNIVNPPAWDEVGDSHHGMTPVRSEGKWGYVDNGGNLVVPCVWDDAWRFSDGGTAVVTLASKRGFIDRIGKVIVKPEWDGALAHTPEGIGAVRSGNGWALVDRSGKLLCDPIWIFKWSERRFEIGFIPAWPMSELGNQSFSSWWRSGRKDSDGQVFLGIDGKPGATPKLREGVCLPRTAAQNIQPGMKSEPIHQEFPFPRMTEGKLKLGLIDLAGKVIFEPVYGELRFIDPETVLLKKDGNGQISDVSGKVILEGKIDNVEVLENRSGFNVQIGAQRVAHWKDWQPVLPKEQDSLTFIDCYGPDLIFREGSTDAPKAWWRADFKTRNLHRFEGVSRLYWVKSLADYQRIWLQDEITKQWYFCTVDGTRLGLEMDEQPSAWFLDEGFGIIWEDAKCYFVNFDGKRLDFGLWEDATVFRNGLAAVKKGGLWGFINSTGKVVIDSKYDEVGNFFVASTDKKAKAPLLASVCKSGKWGFINEKGHLVIPLVGDRKGNWWDGIIYLWGQGSPSTYWDAEGNKVERAYSDPEKQKNRFAGNWLVSENPKGLKGLVDPTRKIALEQEWQAIEWVSSGVAAVRGDHNGGLFSPEKSWLFQDDDKRRLRRNRGFRDQDRLDLSVQRHGFLVIEETPKWGFARWKNLVAVDGLIAHYALDGDTKDSSGMENHMVYNQTQWTEDKHGNPSSAIYLEGTEEFVSCPLNIEPSAIPQMTLVAWARADSRGAWRHVIGGGCHSYSIEIASGWGARGTGGKWGLFGQHKLNVGEWVFIAASYDQDTQNATFRVNEEFFESKMNSHSRSGSFRLGGAGGNTNFKGAIDQVRVYNRVLTKNELDGLYQQFLTGEAK